MRREKEMVDAKTQILSTENSRLQQAKDQAAKQLDIARTELKMEVAKNSQSNVTETEHNKLLAQVSRLNLTQESNMLLRQEKEKLAGQFKQAEAKIKTLESSITPLQQKQKQLVAEKGALEATVKAISYCTKIARREVFSLLSYDFILCMTCDFLGEECERERRAMADAFQRHIDQLPAGRP